ncbi:MAG TPA: N-acetylmuramoyl-L-alanine amidase [Thermoleophilaceae bacterium]|nr:N-acetylmuramoyl-L-alanine amidase [Thermoleophilaceae bacterium]
MKLLASAAALACVAPAALIVAPALSSSPWRPEPVDFELAPRSDPVVARSAGGAMSRPLRPGKRFNLVGLRWRGNARPAVAMRSRRSGGRWTRWVTVGEYTEDAPDPGRGEPEAHGLSMPVWVGEADEVQYRLSRPVRGLRLHFVNVRGTATAADRARTAVRRVASAAVSSIAGLFRGGAKAAQPQPAIVSREDWGAGDCPPRSAPDYGVVKAAFIHHTVNANDYTREEAPSIVLAICRFHRNSNGWNDIGYNFVVDKFGTIYEGRAGGVDQPVVGAQAQGYNAQSTGIANLGEFTSVKQTPAALAAIARLIRWKLPLHGIPTSGSTTLVSAGGASNRYAAGTHVGVRRISGHRDVDATSCPGDALYAQLPALRMLVGSIGPAGTGTTLTAKLSPRTIRYKRGSLLSGTLASSDGRPLVGESVRAQVRRGRRWRTLRTLTSSAGGTFSLVMHPRVNRMLRVHFSGRGELLPARSRTLRLLVRPLVTLLDPPEQGIKGKRVRLRGTVAPRMRRLLLVLQRRRSGRWARVGLRRLKPKRGRFRGSFLPATAGRLRYYVVSPAGTSNARGRSALVEITVTR